MSLANNLKILIASNSDLRSPSDFAKKAGISRQTVHSMIKGKVLYPNNETLAKIAEFFNCHVNQIIEPKDSNISKRLHRLMVNKGVNINQLSKKTGIDNGHISRILNKKVLNPKKTTLKHFAQYFNVPVSYFTDKNNSL